MYITDTLKSFLKDSSLISGNCFYITDLNNVTYFTTSNISANINEPISKELLENLSKFEKNKNDESNFLLFNGKGNVVPVMQEDELNISWTAQIILPLYIKNKLIGSIIMISTYKTFNTKHLEYVRNTRYFIKEFMKDRRL